MPQYRLIKRKAVAELDCPSDLIARQYAQADRGIERVETETGRVVYRKVPVGIDKWADTDLSSFEIDPEAVERFDRATRRKTT